MSPNASPGLQLARSVMIAAGCGGTGRELLRFASLERQPFVTRTFTLAGHLGGAMPRIVEAPSGLLHAVNLHNPGIEVFLVEELPALVRAGAQVFVSLAAGSPSEYAALTRRVANVPGVAGVEVNISSSDAVATPLGPVTETYEAAAVVGAVRRELPGDQPVLVKLRPERTRLVEMVRAVHEAGATAVVVGNAVSATMPDGRPAGLSGPAVRPVALACVRDLARGVVNVPVIAAGGITEASHVREFLAAGAVATQVGTALLHDPTAVTRIVRDLEETP